MCEEALQIMPQGARRVTPHPQDMPAMVKVRKRRTVVQFRAQHSEATHRAAPLSSLWLPCSGLWVFRCPAVPPGGGGGAGQQSSTVARAALALN
jgi:hypothetical protein